MIGAPPLAGFISKWYLGLGALEAGQDWVIPVLVGSSLLNAAYFLPVLYRTWFKAPAASWPAERSFGRVETSLALLVPPLITAFLSLLLGLLASAPFSPVAMGAFYYHAGVCAVSNALILPSCFWYRVCRCCLRSP